MERGSTDPLGSAFKDIACVGYRKLNGDEIRPGGGADPPSLLARFGDHQYSAEELIGELGAAFICAQLGISPQPRVDHAQYPKHWLEMMKADSRAIFTAAARAQEAVTFLTSLRPKPEWL